MPDLYVEGADTIDQIFEKVLTDLDQEKKDRSMEDKTNELTMKFIELAKRDL